MKIKVKATEKGFYGGRIRNEDEVFEVASKKAIGKWMEVIEVLKDTVTPASN